MEDREVWALQEHLGPALRVCSVQRVLVAEDLRSVFRVGLHYR
jgi:hypothetical protein